MEVLAVEGATGSLLENRCQAAERLAAMADRAYRLAFRITGSSAGAEDAVQQAYLSVLGEMPAGLRPDEERLWFLEVVANAAAKQLRGDERRRQRETRAMKDQDSGGSGPEPGEKTELIEILGQALQELDAKYRLPVALCCEQGYSKREAAAVLGMPESTVSKYVSIGLERLQKVLAVAGYTVAPAVVLGGLGQTAPAVPVGLAAAVAGVVSGGKAFLGRAAAGVALKVSSRLAAKKAATLALGWKVAATVSAVAVLGGSAAWVMRPESTPARVPGVVRESDTIFRGFSAGQEKDPFWAESRGLVSVVGQELRLSASLDSPFAELVSREIPFDGRSLRIEVGLRATQNPLMGVKQCSIELLDDKGALLCWLRRVYRKDRAWVWGGRTDSVKSSNNFTEDLMPCTLLIGPGGRVLATDQKGTAHLDATLVPPLISRSVRIRLRMECTEGGRGDIWARDMTVSRTDGWPAAPAGVR